MPYRKPISRRRFLAGGAGGLSALALAACGGSNREETVGTPAASGEPVRGGTVHWPTTVLLGLDPSEVEAQAEAFLLYSYLLQITDWDGTIGDIALSWEVPDQLNWIFKLRNDARFPQAAPTNGRTLVASDIVKSIDRNKTTPGASESWVQFVDSYQAVDDTTLTIRTKKPYAYLSWLLYICPIVPMEAVEAWGDLRSHVAGTGPFVVNKYTPNETLDLVRNPLYYHDYPYVDGFSVRAFSDDAAVQVAFRSGAVDVYFAANKAIADIVRNTPGTRTARYLDRAYANLRCSAKTFEPFKDERVREAVDLSLDRKTIMDKVQFGDAELSGPIPPCFPAALPKEEVEAAYHVDVQKARQLLSAAGQEGLRFGLDIASAGEQKDQAAVIKENLAKAGITVDISSGDYGTWIAKLLGGDFQSTVFNHMPFIVDHIPLQLMHSHGDSRTERNYLGVDDPAVDALIDEAIETLDDAKRIEVEQKAQRLVLERHGPTFLLYQPYRYLSVYDYIKNYYPGVYGFGMAKYDYWVDKSRT